MGVRVVVNKRAIIHDSLSFILGKFMDVRHLSRNEIFVEKSTESGKQSGNAILTKIN